MEQFVANSRIANQTRFTIKTWSSNRYVISVLVIALEASYRRSAFYYEQQSVNIWTRTSVDIVLSQVRYMTIYLKKGTYYSLR